MVQGVFNIKKIISHKTNGVATKSGKRASGNVRIRRSMSDWFHAPLERNIDAFADLVADYYGDKYLVNFSKLGANDAVHGGV